VLNQIDIIGPLFPHPPGSEISSEPMYILLNTAVSKQWGFPKTCPGYCPCKKYDCRSTKWQDTCGFSEGFCDMVVKESPQYKINWVRVYQDPTDAKQKVGCSTPERPTRKFIEAHEKQYKTSDDVSVRYAFSGMEGH
jgi:beta-glucan synthesis-associated protein KRE6